MSRNDPKSCRGACKISFCPRPSICRTVKSPEHLSIVGIGKARMIMPAQTVTTFYTENNALPPRVLHNNFDCCRNSVSLQTTATEFCILDNDLVLDYGFTLSEEHCSEIDDVINSYFESVEQSDTDPEDNILDLTNVLANLRENSDFHEPPPEFDVAIFIDSLVNEEFKDLLSINVNDSLKSLLNCSHSFISSGIISTHWLNLTLRMKHRK